VSRCVVTCRGALCPVDSRVAVRCDLSRCVVPGGTYRERFERTAVGAVGAAFEATSRTVLTGINRIPSPSGERGFRES
jgi:hypothetical protein